MLTLEMKYDLFKTTLEYCNSSLKTQTTDMKDYLLFECLNIDIPCYLSDILLSLFEDKYLIDDKISQKAILLRDLYSSMEDDKDLYNVNMIASRKEWRQLMCLADEILAILYI